MGSTEFNLQQASTSNLFTETRKASKVRFVLAFLLLLFVVLSIVFIVLYVNEKKDADDGTNTGGTSGQGGGQGTTSAPATTKPSSTAQVSTNNPVQSQKCENVSCVLSAADMLQKLDKSVKPCDDFYQYSCGGFVKDRFIPDDAAALNSFSLVGNEVQNNLRALLEDEELLKNYSKNPNSSVSKALNFYRTCMNTTQIENAGLGSMLKLIEDHGSCSFINKTWTDANWELERILGRVMGELGVGVFVSLDISTSLFNTSEKTIAVGAGVSGLGESLSRVDQAQQVRIVQGYLKFIKTVFKSLGADEATLQAYATELLLLEVNFVQTKGNLFEIAQVQGYDKAVKEMTLAELNNLTDYKFNWTTYINEALSVAGKSIGENQKLSVGLPDHLKNIVDLFNSTSTSVLANEVIWNIVKGTITALPEEFREAQDEFTAVTSGIETPAPRWRTCGDTTNQNFEYATTLLYADRHLSEEARKRAADLFTEIKYQFIQGLEEQTWMDNATREQARTKLNSMKQSIGYPAFIKDKTKVDKLYDKITVDVHDLFDTMLNIRKAQVVEKINDLGKAPDESKFPQPPVGVNAFYHPQTNKMTVLVGMLKEPFYGSERLKALNYGSVGMIIGHEITHGFDVSGSQFDENGNLRSWWSTQSEKNFEQRSDCIAEQYNNTYVYERKLDGQKTLSENIADNGGLKYAYRAYKKWRETNGNEDQLPGLNFNNEQLFFIGFAQTWCAKYRDEIISTLLKTDTHSLNPARVRVPLANFPEFHRAFNCQQPPKTCTVW